LLLCGRLGRHPAPARPDAPVPTVQGWSVTIHDLGSAAVQKVRRVIDEFLPGNALTDAQLRSVPVTVCSGVGFATAEGLRRALERLGARAEVRELP
jgi:hypothetical protein